MNSFSPNATRILDIVFLKLDAYRISDPGVISDQILLRELKVFADLLLDNCPHFSPEQTEEVKSEVMSYLESVDRDDLVAAIKSCPKKDRPLVQKLIWCVGFCLFGLLVCLMLPAIWLCQLLEWIGFFPRNVKEIEGAIVLPQSSTYECVCEMADAVAQCLWPEKPAPCYCCSVESGE